MQDHPRLTVVSQRHYSEVANAQRKVEAVKEKAEDVKEIIRDKRDDQ